MSKEQFKENQLSPTLGYLKFTISFRTVRLVRGAMTREFVTDFR